MESMDIGSRPNPQSESFPLLYGILISFVAMVLSTLLTSCERPDPDVATMELGNIESTIENQLAGATAEATSRPLPPTPLIHRTTTPFPSYSGTPTPDPTRSLSEGGLEDYQTHTVIFGETLSSIALQYGSTVEELMQINQFANSDLLAAGQVILVPGGSNQIGLNFKIIPDSELVYGPAARGFDIVDVTAAYGSYLLNYQEEIEGQVLNGPEIVQLVADRHSVNPRLLLTLLEHQSGWLTHPTTDNTEFPLLYVKAGFEGLYKQLRWAANLLNLGYYGRSEGGITSFEINSQTRLAFAGDINDGTAGVQFLFAAYPDTTHGEWLTQVGSSGLFETYNRLFGNPFAYSVDPLWPENLTQPALSLPWGSGEAWYFTGGPHGGWAGGSAWAALDFAPEKQEAPCLPTDAWVTAMADGIVSRSGFGAVVVDMDGDGFAGSGWAITYMHLEPRDRVKVGTIVQTGDRLGHPSCEGGFVNATHVHVARTYNGRWVAADGPVPFVMYGWVSKGLGREYDGLLIRGDVVVEACDCAESWNQITAD